MVRGALPSCPTPELFPPKMKVRWGFRKRTLVPKRQSALESLSESIRRSCPTVLACLFGDLTAAQWALRKTPSKIPVRATAFIRFENGRAIDLNSDGDVRDCDQSFRRAALDGARKEALATHRQGYHSPP